MNRAYMLIIVIQDYHKSKDILKRLEEIGVTGATGLDTMGSSSIAGVPTYDMYEVVIPAGDSELALASNFSKTIFSVVKSEKTVKRAMDEVGKILKVDSEATGKGIMFTIPLTGQMGIL